MKKVILIVSLLFALFFVVLFSACEEKDALAERSIDGVAAYLGYFDGEDIEDVSEKMAGAIGGKYFKDGQVSIFQFDPESKEYEFQQTQTDACVGGFVVLYDIDAHEDMTGYEIMKQTDRIKNIKFKEEASEK